jgi:hypothetical protein
MHDLNRYSIGATVIWRAKHCIITNHYPNGTLVVSPKGNGNAPAKYYTTHERDVELINPLSNTTNKPMTKTELLFILTGTETPKNITGREHFVINKCLEIINSR